jgi:hypothetical protein
MPDLFLSALAVALAAPGGSWAANRPGPAPEQVRAAVVKSIALLEKSAVEYTAHRDCFSCHHQALPVVALSTARSQGYRVSEESLQKQLDFTAKSLAKNRDNYQRGRGQGGQATTAGYALLTLELGGWKADSTTSAMAEYFLLRDKDADHWPVTSRRPPSEASSFTTTYLALRGLRAFASPEQEARVRARAARVLCWLLDTPPKDTEDRVFRLGALELAGAADKDIRDAVKDLIQSQNTDGGWSQTSELASDAYATGSALVMLHQTGAIAIGDPVYQRGLSFLIRTQLPDGSWRVRSRSTPFQTYFESGFPHGKDQFISIAASSWATAALTLAYPAVPPASAPLAAKAR